MRGRRIRTQLLPTTVGMLVIAQEPPALTGGRVSSLMLRELEAGWITELSNRVRAELRATIVQRGWA
ncbi:hypothetical protein LshimejAT787_0804300 [Lyophyllum shimeji]|uniref:Uncharacterized protein n=1 Tax=Lyophyllum shimeji TaxID=47721 RepID=A0A9P3PS78_LYOSH|nr:hypothetical protein LshimejAT787_0804300 [Lyophyllum shimeji]